MKQVLGLLESLNEWVYIADMDSYELIYMNSYLRKIYGLASSEDYKGKKCYSVLQGKTQPCSFCTNKHLYPGKFYEWSFQNPILNKTVFLKDTMFEENGCRYRLEIAIDTQPNSIEEGREHLLAYGESIVNECLRKAVSISEPAEAIDGILAFMGEHFQCERVYIFETHPNQTFSNTYEWCAPNVTPQKDLLKDEPIESIDWWFQLFEDEKPVIIEDLESIRESSPYMYACLKVQDISSLVTVPIYSSGKVLGFLGVDNPSNDQLKIISSFLFVIGHFLSSLIERRNLLSHLEHMSYHDQLTGALNRHAFHKAADAMSDENSAGIVYCDISGLKTVNDNLGHEAGDEMILHWYRILRYFFREEEVFRTGGDEFVVLCPDVAREEFDERILNLCSAISQESYHLSMGSAWDAGRSGGIQDLLTLAEKRMYEDKYDYYSKQNRLSAPLSQHHHIPIDSLYLPGIDKNSYIYQYMQHNYFDAETLFKSITMQEAPYYLFFGDLRTDLFYVSDSMRDRFGFKSNIVYDLIGSWESRIVNKVELERYRQDVNDILYNKKSKHDLRYRVKDKDGQETWIRCYGLVKWNEEQTEPLFFSGFISYQESEFIIDPITNFPREYAVAMKLKELQDEGSETMILGFTLNNFSEINELRGRHNADILLKNISERLTQHFEDMLYFYRLDGLRFLAIVSTVCEESLESIATQIREIVTAIYRSHNVMVRVPCSVGMFCEDCIKMTPQEILDNLSALLSVAKHTPDQEYIVHSPESILIQRRHAQMVMELSSSVYNDFDGFRLVVQPTVSVRENAIVSGEALLRWRFNGEDISPLMFIPILEKNRLIIPVGKWVFEQVVRTCTRLISYCPKFRLAFNVSYHQILDDSFIPFMKNILAKYKLPGKHLIMELTETHFDEMPEKLEEFIGSCKALGIDIALDDFGNGYSSLGLLLKYPASIVKLDRSLLNSMTNSEDNINFISSIVYACHKFGKYVCAEGVETQEELDIVLGTGCDMIQGFYFYRPMELKDLHSLLAEQEDRMRVR